MPYRKIPLANGETYHVFNRGFLHKKIFLDENDYSRAYKSLSFYKYNSPNVKFSYFQQRTKNEQKELLASFNQYNPPGINLYAYCFMPNHFHLLVKQTKENCLLNTIKQFSNSYSKYFNLKHEQEGPLFQGRFQAVRVITNEQFLHVHRYIHLNPFTSSVVTTKSALLTYPYSSLEEFINPNTNSICETSAILDQFPTNQAYQNFILDQADYQKELHSLKALLLE